MRKSIGPTGRRSSPTWSRTRACSRVGRDLFEEAEIRAFVGRDYDRAGGYLAATNHGFLTVGEWWRGRVAEMTPPLLVIHGTADPVYPIEHGVALSEAVRGARLVRLEGGGHELHPIDWDTIIGAIVEHTAPASVRGSQVRAGPQTED